MSKHSLRRILSLLLAVLMVCTLLPTAALAAEGDDAKSSNPDQDIPATTAPAAPTYEELQELFNNKALMGVECPTRHNGNKYTGGEIYSLLAGSYDVTEVIKDETGYTCYVTVKKSAYADYVKIFDNSTGAAHTYLSTDRVVEHWLKYDSSTGKWTFVNEMGTPMISAMCPPDESTAGNWNLKITCGKCEAAGKYLYEHKLSLAEGKFSVSGVKQDENGYYCEITVNADAYIDIFSSAFKYNIGKYHARSEGEAAEQTFKVYCQNNGAGWRWPISNTIGALDVTCDAVPPEPAPPTGGFEEFIKENTQVSFLCADFASTEHGDKQYALIDGTYKISDVSYDGDGVYYCTIILTAPEKYLEQYNKDTGGSHCWKTSITTTALSLFYTYNTTADKQWQYGGYRNFQFDVSCKTPAPEKPGDDVVKELLGENAVSVRCKNAAASHDAKTYSLLDGTYTIGNVTFSGGYYTCEITLTNPEEYVTKFNDDSPSYPQHTLSDAQCDAQLRYKYDEENEAWSWEPWGSIEIGIDCGIYTVTYTDGVDGRVFADQSHKKLSPGTATPEFTGTPERESYVFAGWTPEVADTVTADATYTAVWKEDSNGNGIPDDEEERYTVAYTDGVSGKAFRDEIHEKLLPGTATPEFTGTPERESYVFAGWTPEVADTVTADATYTAVWKEDSNGNGIPDDEEERYTVTYTDGVDGRVFADQSHKKLLPGADTPEFVGTPERESYVFAGWMPEVADTVTGSATYTAKWTPVTYTVTFDSNGGSAVESRTATVEDTLTEPTAPTKTGYAFDGWYLDGTKYDFTAPVTESITLTAQWTPVPYTVSYELDGGTAEGNPESYTVESESFTLKNPARSGYTFTGWSGTGLDGEKNMTVTVETGSTGDRAYTAHWSKNASPSGGYTVRSYTIRASVTGSGTISPTGSVSVSEGGSRTFTFAPDKGYALCNVLVDGKEIGAVESYTFKNVRSGHTIEAVFMEEDGNPKNGVAVSGKPTAAEFRESTPEERLEKLEAARKANGDTVAWLYIPAAEIDMPVLQTENNAFYLRMGTDKSYAPWGSVYADCRAEQESREKLSANTAIFGASAENGDPDGECFSKLFRYLDAEFVEENPYIYLTLANGEELVFRIGACFVTDTEFDYIRPELETDEEWNEYLESVGKKNLFDITGGQLEKGDTLLTLTTYSAEYDTEKTGEQRFAIVAKLLPEGEAAAEYTVKDAASPELPEK